MASYTNINDGNNFWNNENKMYTNSYYDTEAEYNNLQSQQLG